MNPDVVHPWVGTISGILINPDRCRLYSAGGLRWSGWNSDGFFWEMFKKMKEFHHSVGSRSETEVGQRRRSFHQLVSQEIAPSDTRLLLVYYMTEVVIEGNGRSNHHNPGRMMTNSGRKYLDQSQSRSPQTEEWSSEFILINYRLVWKR